MTILEGSEPMLDRVLAGLPVRDADPERVGRIRARCLDDLARSRKRRAARREATALWRARAETLAATGLAALLLAAAVERALEVFR